MDDKMDNNIGKLIKLKIFWYNLRFNERYTNTAIYEWKNGDIFWKTEDFCLPFLIKLWKFMWNCESVKIFVVIFTDTMVGIQINNIVQKETGDIF